MRIAVFSLLFVAVVLHATTTDGKHLTVDQYFHKRGVCALVVGSGYADDGRELNG